MSYQSATPIVHFYETYPQPVTALSFDPVSDTLWAGTQTGQVAAFHSSHQRSVCFPTTKRDQGGLVRRIHATETHVRALSSVAGAGMGAWSKGAVPKWSWSPDNHAQISDFCAAPASASTLVAATSAPEFVILNAGTGQAVRSVPAPALLTSLAPSHTSVVSGGGDGQIRAHDLRTGSTVASVRSHVGGVQAVAAAGSYAFSIGWALRQGRPHADPLVKVYDVRMLRALVPIPFPTGPGFINLHPKRSSTLIITSATGLVHIVDVNNPTANTEFLQLPVETCLTSAAVSPTGGYLAFGDMDGLIHIATVYDTSEGAEVPPFNGFDGVPWEWAPPPDTVPDIEWTDRTPLNIIGMPFYDRPLFSSWTPKFLPSNLSWPPPQKIPPQVLSSLQLRHGLMSAAVPRELKGKRNVVQTAAKIRTEGRFRSDRGRRSEALPDTPTELLGANEVPRAYHKVEIEYSKFGVEDFDFGYYNKTNYAGLETHIQGCYTNALLQALHYTLPIRQVAKSHITTDCSKEHCTLCEFGFLVRMLEDARGKNCHTSNFCNTFTSIPAAAAMGIVDFEYDTAKGERTDYVGMIQQFNRFLTEQMAGEGNAFPLNPHIVPPKVVDGVVQPAKATLTQLMGIDAKDVFECSSCGAQREKDRVTTTVDLMYPRKWIGEHDFASLLRLSILREREHKATCPSCHQQTTMRSLRAVRSSDLPPLLSVNACAYDAADAWTDVRGAPPILTSHVSIQLEEDAPPVKYEVRALVVQVASKEELVRPHLVALVKVPDAEKRSDLASAWHLFNDFVVKNVTEDEALRFPGKWKIPTVIYLERVDMRDNMDLSQLRTSIDPAILSRDISISQKRDRSLIRHEPLGVDELPTPGYVIAIDAEFVQLQEAETEVRSDGTKKTLRPPRRSLARVSVLRGSGPKEGIPLIDDHIHTTIPIVNYLTEFSGIHQGDLDPSTSRYTLVPRKVAYKKLRLLVDLGCMFVGHGLMNDFRTINIHVPPEQVIDTFDVYFLQNRHRRLNLRFLSWFVLKQEIQTANHDSIEDARAALLLYKKWHESAEGEFSKILEALYRDGKEHNYRAPSAQPSPVPAPSQAAVGASSAHRTLGLATRDRTPEARVTPFTSLSPLSAGAFSPHLGAAAYTAMPYAHTPPGAFTPHSAYGPSAFDIAQALRQHSRVGSQPSPFQQHNYSPEQWQEIYRQEALRRMSGPS
ncbi:hypothetical protein AURDEDRAFT_87257 [Auricularia subglabra TFB-10046 SS5]|nr:hypothetical protein AURDEDRAFT_87257 [Auricularia subglabra TFB-10046 SS5]